MDCCAVISLRTALTQAVFSVFNLAALNALKTRFLSSFCGVVGLPGVAGLAGLGELGEPGDCLSIFLASKLFTIASAGRMPACNLCTRSEI